MIAAQEGIFIPTISKILFYGGITAAVVFFAALIAAAVLLRLKWLSLSAKLNEEYGKKLR